jgi:IS4 transposase
MGFRWKVSRSTLADANETRDFRIYQDFGHILIGIARKLYQGEDLGLDLQQTVYALDSTTIDLCLSTFPWAAFRKSKAAVKMHTLLDLRGAIPTFVSLTTGKTHDVKMMDAIPIDADTICTMDRGYLDFQRLYQIHVTQAFFVIRAKHNMRFRRLYSNPVDKTTGIQADQSIVLVGYKSRTAYPETLRRVRYYDVQQNKRLVFLTNHFGIPAKTVADIYHCRWQVELFFKWIKQHLRIKTFYGTSPNAVKTQIWIAISIYLLVAIVKKRLNLPGSLHTILQVLEVNIFEKKDIYQTVSDALKQETENPNANQLILFT